MNDERVVEEIVTKFILNTCRLNLKFSEPALQAAVICGQLVTEHPGNSVDEIPLTTGSVAEFYIEPMVPHVGDIDVMSHHSTQLAIPAGHPPPTQLPAEFHNYVQVFEIVDSHLPGYVYLVLRYLLTECVDNGKYDAVEYDRDAWLAANLYDDLSHFRPRAVGVIYDIHGPALQAISPDAVTFYGTGSFDRVFCIR